MAGGEFVTLARVVKTQGRHGEVAVEIHTDVPDRFSVGLKLLALDKAGESRRPVQVEDLWPHKGLLILKFAGIDSISDAEKLIGSELQVPRADRAPLEQGWSYVSDLVGCQVFDQGRQIGRIEDVQFGAGEAPLLIVSGADGKKYDVPFAEAYVEGIDLAGRQLRMSLPEGMLEINAPLTPEEKKQQRFGKESKVTFLTQLSSYTVVTLGPKMKADIVTIFPDFFRGPLDYGITRRAAEMGLVEIQVHDLREFTHDRHRTVDDRPFGGGEGMVLKPEPIFDCLERIPLARRDQRLSRAVKESVILLSAQGQRFTQEVASDLSTLDRIVLISGLIAAPL